MEPLVGLFPCLRQDKSPGRDCLSSYGTAALQVVRTYNAWDFCALASKNPKLSLFWHYFPQAISVQTLYSSLSFSAVLR